MATATGEVATFSVTITGLKGWCSAWVGKKMKHL